MAEHQQWEYAWVKLTKNGWALVGPPGERFDEQPVNDLDALQVAGARGWELVAVTPDPDTSGVYVMKRPVDHDADMNEIDAQIDAIGT